jgi:hypothetical protein
MATYSMETTDGASKQLTEMCTVKLTMQPGYKYGIK